MVVDVEGSGRGSPLPSRLGLSFVPRSIICQFLTTFEAEADDADLTVNVYLCTHTHTESKNKCKPHRKETRIGNEGEKHEKCVRAKEEPSIWKRGGEKKKRRRKDPGKQSKAQLTFQSVIRPNTEQS